jgi:hypothetical protein
MNNFRITENLLVAPSKLNLEMLLKIAQRQPTDRL